MDTIIELIENHVKQKIIYNKYVHCISPLDEHNLIPYRFNVVANISEYYNFNHSYKTHYTGDILDNLFLNYIKILLVRYINKNLNDKK